MSIRDRIEHLKAKPEHVRRRVALLSAGGVAGLVLVGWAVVLTTSGTLALNNTQTAEPDFGSVQEINRSLAGAAASFSSVVSGEGTLSAVETKASSTLDQEDPGEATVIPF